PPSPSPLFPYTTLFRSRRQPTSNPSPRPIRSPVVSTVVTPESPVPGSIAAEGSHAEVEPGHPPTSTGLSHEKVAMWAFLGSECLDRKSTRLNSSHLVIS